jgi:hypothetical protein
MATPQQPRERPAAPVGSVPLTHPAFGPYVVALGQLTLAWNELHESLALLFCTVMGGGYVNQFLAVWHAVNSDRNQRAILKAAVESDVNRPDLDARHKNLVEDIRWLCGQANTLEDLRNDALHSPLWGFQRKMDEVVVMPIVGLGHVRAKKLWDKNNLLGDFRWCRDMARLLTAYARSLDRALTDCKQSWPDRPKPPEREDTKLRKRRRPTRKEAQPRQPEPSQA